MSRKSLLCIRRYVGPGEGMTGEAYTVVLTARGSEGGPSAWSQKQERCDERGFGGGGGKGRREKARNASGASG